ncbi:MAG: hypothetical protein WBD07_13585 [Vicinamibacterales bacterium]
MDTHESHHQDPVETPKRAVGAPAVLAALVLGAIIGGMAVEYWLVTRGTPPAEAQTGAEPSAALAADVARLKALLPTQSHIMNDVAYHWSNLWFAVEKNNWPLARYSFDEARQSVRWAVLLRPVRKLQNGKDVDVKGIFDGVDPSAFATVQIAIEDKDTAAFADAYKQALVACYSCHKAVGHPELHPMVPTAPPTTIINFDPNAKWPE